MTNSISIFLMHSCASLSKSVWVCFFCNVNVCTSLWLFVCGYSWKKNWFSLRFSLIAFCFYHFLAEWTLEMIFACVLLITQRHLIKYNTKNLKSSKKHETTWNRYQNNLQIIWNLYLEQTFSTWIENELSEYTKK